MKVLFMVPFFLILIFMSCGKSSIETKYSVYNYYVKGLVLYKIPSITDPTQIKIDLGEKIDVISNTGIKFDTNGYYGEWLKVKYKKNIGYVYDCYLSPLIFPSTNILNASPVNNRLKYYFIDTNSLLSNELFISNTSVTFEKFILSNGIQYIGSRSSDFQLFSFDLPNNELKDILLVFSILNQKQNININQADEKEEEYSVKYNREYYDDKTLKYFSIEASGYVSISFIFSNYNKTNSYIEGRLVQ